MKLVGRFNHIKNHQLVIDLDRDENVNKILKLLDGQNPSIEIDVGDARQITPSQRKKIWALIREISEWNGDLPQVIEDYMKSYTREIFNLDQFSLSNCSVTIANDMLYTILEFCFRNEVPFKTSLWDSIPSDYARQWYALRFRKCVICGKHADVAHLETVGMGRNRHKISHEDYHFMALCRFHHEMQHKIGIENFIIRFHLKPIKLNGEERKRLRIGG